MSVSDYIVTTTGKAAMDDLLQVSTGFFMDIY